MYYGYKVVAWKASGPNLIIESERPEWLAENKSELLDHILNTTDVSGMTHNRMFRILHGKVLQKKYIRIYR